jgi:hypothetical protein
MTQLPQRIVGIVIMGAVLFTLDLGQPNVAHALGLPLLLAAAAYLITQSLMAVALATFTLAAANADLGADFWVLRWGYPTVAAISLAVCLVLAAVRFRDRVRATREARWANREKANDR